MSNNLWFIIDLLFIFNLLIIYIALRLFFLFTFNLFIV